MKAAFTPALLPLLALPAFAAFSNGYSNCKVVTTQHSMVSGASDLANYPLTVILTDADLRTSGNGGLVNNANGYDIGFYPDCSGSGAALKWEMESYSATTGAIVAHVLRPALSHTVNDTIGMFYGGAFSSFQSTPSAVWNVNYKGVWHLSNGTTLSLADSTGSHNGTNNNSTAGPGQIGGGNVITTTNNWSASDTGLPSGGGARTFSFWVRPDSTALDGTRRTLFQYSQHGSAGQSQVIELYDASHIGYFAWADDIPLATYSFTAGTWYKLDVAYDGTNGYIYINGSNVVTAAPSTGWNTTLAGTIYFGLSNYGSGNYSGGLDEIRISNSVRSADWILTEYRNQSAPGTYISAGPRVTGTRVRHAVIGGF